MNHRIVAAAVAGWCLFIIALGIGASILNGKSPLEQLAPAIILCAVGVLLAAKVPENRISWLLLIAGVFTAWLFVGNSIEPDQWLALFPEVVVIAFVWSGNIIWFVIPVTVITIVFLFPTGRLPSRRWRPLAWVGLAGSTLMFIALAFETTGYEEWPFESPVHMDDADLLFLIPGFLLFVVFTLGAVVSLFVRYRSSNGDQKAQIRWVLFASVMALALYASGSVVSRFIPGGWGLIFAVTFAAVPVAIAVAILRYRLYDIDKIVSRTVAYALVAGTLALVFIAGAVWLPQILPTGNNSFAVAATTLAVAALFNPVRRRAKRTADRRFNRLPYDPEKIAQDLEHQIRDGVGSDDLARIWMQAATDSLEPSTAGVWVRSDA